MNTVFLRILDAQDKALALLEATQTPESGLERVRFEVDPKSFAEVPGSPFVYWVSNHLRSLFGELPDFEAEDRVATIGVSTKDDFRYIRSWSEIGPSGVARTRDETTGRRWVALTKGGRLTPYYSDVALVVDWGQDGRSLKASISEYRGSRGWGYQWSAALNGHSFYFRPGLTWPYRPHRRGAFSHVHPGGIFAASGPMLFCNAMEHWSLCAILNSDAYVGLLHFLMPRGATRDSGQTLKYEVGYITAVPIPEVQPAHAIALATLARRAWSLRRSLDTVTETSHAFAIPALLQMEEATLAARATAWASQVAAIEIELGTVQAEIDDRCFGLYGMDSADRRAVTESFDARDLVGETGTDDGPDGERDEEADSLGATVATAGLSAALISWAVGVAFGRFDLRHATGERELPLEPEPFDPLPVCSPGMLTGSDGLPAEQLPEAYGFDWLGDAGIMVDDSGHPDDLEARVRRVLGVVFGAAADSWWEDCARVLGGDLRRWLSRSFFEVHLKAYSKSRRKAPVYWQLATPSASYSVWLYAHRASGDTMYRVLNDYVTPKLHHEERKLTNLMQEAGPSPSGSQRKDIESQRDFVEEMRSFRDEVARVAPLWRPELDDGILVTCAPLWRLVPQHRIWQREVQSCWAKTASGEYEWSQVSMRLWPERVVPECAADRSLAIAHGLEEEFWAKDADGKWASRQIDGATVERLVRERSSAAVKAALADLLTAG